MYKQKRNKEHKTSDRGLECSKEEKEKTKDFVSVGFLEVIP